MNNCTVCHWPYAPEDGFQCVKCSGWKHWDCDDPVWQKDANGDAKEGYVCRACQPPKKDASDDSILLP